MRDNSISVAKAFAIMFMVLAHTWFSEYGSRWINMFHMPLFFFFAGYCFKEKYLACPMQFTQKRIKGLYKPFVKWSVVFLALHNVFYALNIYNGQYGFQGHVSSLYDYSDFARKLLYIITKMTDNEQLLGGYWFLRSLFVGSIVGFAIIKYIKSPILGGAIMLVLTIALSFLDIKMPYFYIGARESFATLFFVLGYAYKKLDFTIHKNSYCLFIGVVLVTIGASFVRSSMLDFKWSQVVPYVLVATSGILATFYLSQKVVKSNNFTSRVLVYIGNNTLTILTWHFLSFKLVSLVIIQVNQLPIARLAEFPVITDYSAKGWFVLYFLIGVALPLMLSKNKYLK